MYRRTPVRSVLAPSSVLVTTSKALVTRSDALVPSNVLAPTVCQPFSGVLRCGHFDEPLPHIGIALGHRFQLETTSSFSRQKL